MVTFLKDVPSADGGSNADPLKALESLAEIRRGLPPMDIVEMIQEGREDLAARCEPCSVAVVVDSTMLTCLISGDGRAGIVSRQFVHWFRNNEALHAPALLSFEVADFLTRLVTSGRLSHEQVRTAFSNRVVIVKAYQGVGSANLGDSASHAGRRRPRAAPAG